MTASATPWPDQPRTGLDALRVLLATPRSPASRALWDLLHRAYPEAIRMLAHPRGALRTRTTPRADLEPRDIERLVLAWRWHAEEILEDLHRALIHSPHTLAALAKGLPNPVHGSERRALCATVSRRLLILGCEPDEVAVRLITYEAVGAIREALLRLEAPLDLEA